VKKLWFPCQAEAWCKTKKNVSLFETSALSQKNLKKAFERVAIAASEFAPAVALVDVKDFTNPVISYDSILPGNLLLAPPVVTADSDDGKGLKEEPELEPDDEPANAVDAADCKYVDEEDEVIEDVPPPIPYQTGRMDSIRLDDDSTESGSLLGCCGM